MPRRWRRCSIPPTRATAATRRSPGTCCATPVGRSRTPTARLSPSAPEFTTERTAEVGDLVLYFDGEQPYHVGVVESDDTVVSATLNGGIRRTPFGAFAGEIKLSASHCQRHVDADRSTGADASAPASAPKVGAALADCRYTRGLRRRIEPSPSGRHSRPYGCLRDRGATRRRRIRTALQRTSTLSSGGPRPIQMQPAAGAPSRALRRCLIGAVIAVRPPVSPVPQPAKRSPSSRAGSALRRTCPAPVAAAAKRHLLDVIGVALASSTDAVRPHGAAARRRRWAAPGDGTVIGFADRLPPAWSALVNGALAHGIDYDDTHEEARRARELQRRPAALAAAEASGADGRALPHRPRARHGERRATRSRRARRASTTAASTPPASAGPSPPRWSPASLAGLPAARLADALGLAGSMASGSDGVPHRRHLVEAHPRRLGRARRPRRGAPRRAPGSPDRARCLDGRFGFYRSHLGDDGWDARRGDARSRPALAHAGDRPEALSGCHMTHAFIDCAASLRGERRRRPGRDRRDRVLHPSARDAGRLRAARDRSWCRRPTTTRSSACRTPSPACWCAATSTSTTSPTQPIRDPAVLDLARRVDLRARPAPPTIRTPSPAGCASRCATAARSSATSRSTAAAPSGRCRTTRCGEKFRRNAAGVPRQVDALAAAGGADASPSAARRRAAEHHEGTRCRGNARRRPRYGSSDDGHRARRLGLRGGPSSGRG